MNLFILFILGMMVIGLRLAKEHIFLTHLVALCAAAFLAFAYFYLDQI